MSFGNSTVRAARSKGLQSVCYIIRGGVNVVPKIIVSKRRLEEDGVG